MQCKNTTISQTVISHSADAVENSLSSIRALAGLLDRHLVETESAEGPLFNSYELGGITQAIGLIAGHAQEATDTIHETLPEVSE
jgi:hypothetical protein